MPKAPPVPGNPHLNQVQDEMERLQGRGTGKERPENEGDFSPDDPVLKDVNPITLEDVGDTSRDGGDDAGTEAAELEEELAAKLPSMPPEPVEERTWGINDLRSEWTPEDLQAAINAGHPKGPEDDLKPVDRGKKSKLSNVLDKLTPTKKKKK